MKRIMVLTALLLALAMTRSVQAQDDGYCGGASPEIDDNSMAPYRVIPRSPWLDSVQPGIDLRLPFCGSGWSVYYRGYNHAPDIDSLDFNEDGGDEGVPVVAAADGTIYQLGYDCLNNPSGASYGTYVVLSHANGYKTRYAHLQCGSTAGLKIGNTVVMDQQIGKVGDTGAALGSHLHFELIYAGSVVPASFRGVGLLSGIYSTSPYLNTGYDRMTAEPCGVTYPPPPPTFTRAFELGQGTGTPEAWVEGFQKAGGFNELGIAITSPAWDNGYVYQIFIRPDTGVVSILIHDQNHNVPYAYGIIDAFYAYWKSQGGMAVVGAPIGNKYDLGGGNYRQDFTNGYITNDSQGFHFWKNYPFGYTPGQGSANPGAFQFGYTQVGGNAFGNPTSAIFIKNGNEVQAYQTPSGKSVWMVLIPGYSQAFGVSGVMYDAWMQSGNVFGGWGVPISPEYYIGPNQTMQRFRYGTAYKNDKNVVAFTPTSPAGTKLYAPGEGMTPDHAAHIITAYERSGGVGKLGPCTAAYDINGYNYQYCSGGAYSGRAAVVLNYNWNGYVAVVVRGSIEAYWESNGGIGGPLGTPYTEEFPSTLVPGSQVEEFGHKIMQWYGYAPHVSDYPFGFALGDGATYWSAFAIMRRYDGDKAGYPKTSVYWTGQGQAQDQGNGIYSGKVSYIHDSTSRAARAYLIKGGVGAKWWALGGGNSYLGLPVTDEIQNGTKVTQYFQYGVISGDTNTGVYQDRKY